MFFTLFWFTGERQVIKGDTIDEAFTNAGYGAGAVAAVDYYSNGITDDHYFSDGGRWERYTPAKFFEDESKNIGETKFTAALMKNRTVDVVYLDGRVLSIAFDWIHDETEGWVEVVKVTLYSENYFFDPSDETILGEVHYFSPLKIAEAMKYFVARVEADGSETEWEFQTLAEIATHQDFLYI